ncbi:type II secretion system protein GspL [Plesiomonas shigelloides]|uniref:type II secretion system protein GspL n=1 Tax=Plesiomonas shigelloides TaxID=703 RepID=UPI002245FA65|nr:type II secretion system protein GspL [Plesiomonas shigelloides]MCX2499064.1 type II secretion system protein GspL [Plesiomonas shigelloides]
MSELLSLLLPVSAEQPIRWQCVALEPASGALAKTPSQQGQFGHAELESVAALVTPNTTVQLLIPGEWVSIWSVTLPKGAQRQADKVIPALLEEELTQDIELLHCSLLQLQGDKASVAVIEHRRMQQIVDWLAQANITSARVLPDWAALPENSLLIAADRVLCHQQGWHGFSAEMALASVLMQADSYHDEMARGESPAPEWQIFSAQPLTDYPALLTALAGDQLARDAHTLMGKDINTLVLTTLSAAIASNATLLTGRWRLRTDVRRQWRRWRPLAFTAALLLSLLTVERAVALWSVAQQSAQARQVAEQQFRQLFPEQKRIVNLRAQLNAALRETQSASSTQELLVLLPTIAQALDSAALATPVSVLNLRFDQPRQEVRLKLRAGSFSDFDTLRRQLALHFSVELSPLAQESSVNRSSGVSGGVSGEFILRGGKA